MNHAAIQGLTFKPEYFGKGKSISFSFPLKGLGKIESTLSFMKKVYEKSFLHDFKAVLTSKVE